MADYYSPFVISPPAPFADITPLEYLLLTHMLQSEEREDGLYLFCERDVECMPAVRAGELRQAYAGSFGVESSILSAVQLWLEEIIATEDDDDTDFDLDAHLEHSPYLMMLQDITRRSKAVTYFTLSGAYTCTKMRADGFGGWAALIYADDIRMQSTNDLLETFINEAKIPQQTLRLN